MKDSGTTRIAPVATLDISGMASKFISGRRKLENLGTVDWTSGDVTGSSTVTIDNQNSFRMSGDVTLVDGGNGVPKQFFNTGTITRDTTDGVAAIEFDVENSGTIEAETGTLFLSGTLTDLTNTTLSDGTWHVASTLKFDTTSDTETLAANVILEGQSAHFLDRDNTSILANLATITAAGSLQLLDVADMTLPTDLQNDGHLLVGPNSVLAIENDYFQSAEARLTIEMAGAPPTGEFGRVVVTGQAALDGTLELIRLDEFLPPPGQDYEIMTFAGRVANSDFPH